MALQKSFEAEFGHIFDTAYHRVVGLVMDVGGRAVRITVAVYKDAPSRLSKQPFIVKSYNAVDGKITNEQTGVEVILTDFTTYFGTQVLDTANPVKRAYLYLKDKVDYYKDSIEV